MARRPVRAYRGPMRSGRVLVALTVLAAASAVGGCGTTATRVAQDAGETHAKAATPSVRRPDGSRYDLDLAYDARSHTTGIGSAPPLRNVIRSVPESVKRRAS